MARALKRPQQRAKGRRQHTHLDDVVAELRLDLDARARLVLEAGLLELGHLCVGVCVCMCVRVFRGLVRACARARVWNWGLGVCDRRVNQI